MWKILTAYSASQNKKKVYPHDGCILKIEGAPEDQWLYKFNKPQWPYYGLLDRVFS